MVIKGGRVIERIIKSFCKSYQKILETVYYPNDGDKGITEANLVFRFCNEYMRLRKKEEAQCFLEVPFKTPSSKGRKYMDAFVFDKDYGIFIEAKRLGDSDQIKSLERDAKRLLKKRVMDGVLDRFHKNVARPKKYFSLLLAESWQEKDAKWWIGEESDEKETPSLNKFEKFDFAEIYNSKEDGYGKCLYAFKDVTEIVKPQKGMVARKKH